MSLERFQKDPFRLFFPLGCLFAIMGLVPWLSILAGDAQYPVQFHKVIMINGFILSFVCGFLMTAIPRFTKTEYARSWEVTGAFILLMLTAGLSLANDPSFHYLTAALIQVFIFVFAFRRFLKRKSDPPVSFTFVGLGIGLWFSSNLYFFLSWKNIVTQDNLSLWQAIFSHGAILSLILGIGSRLLPALLGWQEVIPTEAPSNSQRKVFIGLTGAFLLTYFVQLPGQVHLILRLAIVLFLALRYWKIFKFPKVRNWFNWNLWLSSWCVLLGVAFFLVNDGRAVHYLHLLLVAGFSWMTFLISLHVEMAHRDKPDFAFKNSKVFLLLGGIILLAMVTRVTAILWPHIYLKHLGYAAITLLIGIGIWAWMFLVPRGRRS